MLELFHRRRRAPTANDTACGDCDECRLAITDADGSVARYSTSQLHDAQPPIDGVVEVASLQAFLDTFDCYESGFNPLGGNDSGVDQWSTAPILSSVDSACSHGILHDPCEDKRFWLAVAAPGPFRIAVEECTTDLSFELLDAEMAVLASAAGSAAECPAVVHEFAAGNYGLLLRRPASEVCEDRGSYYRLRVSEGER